MPTRKRTEKHQGKRVVLNTQKRQKYYIGSIVLASLRFVESSYYQVCVRVRARVTPSEEEIGSLALRAEN